MKLKKIAIMLAALAVLPSCGSKEEIKPTKNLIVMITDGTSTGLLSTTRWYKQYVNPQDDLSSLAIDPYICGLVRTHSSDAPIAESSGSMSVYMTGVLQQGRNISVYPHSNPPQNLVPIDETREFQPLATLLEAARIQQGKATGVVARSYFYHATPAATSAHTVERSTYYDIVRQMASNGLDVCFGGGDKMVDDHVRQILSEQGTALYEKDTEGFRAHKEGKAWAIFNDGHMPYQIDSDGSEPTLREMTEKALELLSKNPKGFFLMVEGSRVDMAAHAKDPVGTVHEFIEFNDAVQAVMDFARKDGNTTVVIMPDHGTGGITMGDANYANYTKQPLDSMFHNFVKFKASGEKMEQLVKAADPSEIRDIFKEWDDIDLSESEFQAILAHKDKIVTDHMKVSLEPSLSAEINKIVTSRTHIAFISGNHTGEDVFLAVYNPNGQRPQGLVRNTELNRWMRKYLGLKKDLETMTEELYVPHQKVFEGLQYETFEGEDGPVLRVVSGGKTLEVPSNRSYVLLDGVRIELGSVACYIRENGNFYLPANVRNLL